MNVAESELSAVVSDSCASRASTPDAHEERRRSWLVAAVVVPLALLFTAAEVGSGLETHRTAGARASPRSAVEVRLTSVIVSRAGGIGVHEGEQCTIVIADTGDRDVGRACTIDVRCPNLVQSFEAESCPIGAASDESVRMKMTGLEIDASTRRATFMSFDRAGNTLGGATLRLDASL